nr:YihY/virulence factor BrkB family protein [uncultured Peptostreptococcus sp.]
MKLIKIYNEKVRPLVNQFNIADMYSRAAEAAYYLTLSIFPSLMFLMCAFAYMPAVVGDFVETSIQYNVPTGASNILLAIVDSAIKNRSIRLLIITFLIAVWTFSKAVKSLITGQNVAYNFEETRSFIRLNLYAFLYAIAFFLAVILAVVFLVYGGKLADIIRDSLDEFYLLSLIYNFIRFVVPIIFILLIFLNFYVFGPCRPIKIRQALPGACLTTILWVALSIGYSFYIDRFSDYKEIYGNISTIIVLMTWIYLCSISITIGYKINALNYWKDHLKNRRKLK